MTDWLRDPEKIRLRRELLPRRRALTETQRAQMSRDLFARVQKSVFYAKARNIFCYLSLPEEVQTDCFLAEMLSAGKKVFVPLITGRGRMEAVQLFSLQDLLPDAYGIRTVREDRRQLCPPEKIDCIIVPGAAFGPKGERLGMGGGYYDRFFLRAVNAFRAGVAFSCQLAEGIPMHSHDGKVDVIVTEKEIIACKEN